MLAGREARFDGIVLDVMLPKKDGFAVCRELRALGVRTPILVLTAKTQEADKILGLEIGRGRLRDEAVQSGGAARPDSRGAAGAGRDDLATSTGSATLEVDFSRHELRRSGAGRAADPARVPAARGLHSPSRPRARRVSASSTPRGATTRSSPIASSTIR